MATHSSHSQHHTHPQQAASWTTSVFLNANFAYNSFTRSLGEPYKSSQSSAASEIAAFVSTASNYSIPAAVTETTTTQTFYGAPTWYSALPSGARAFKEQQVSDQFSIVRQVIGSRQTTASSSGAASVPTGRPFVRVEFGAMAAAAAAAFL
jgi:hypothetical protein